MLLKFRKVEEVDIPLLYEHGMEMRVGYTQAMFGMKEQFTGIHTDFDPARDMVPEPAPDKKFLPLQDGMIFDLGGISVEVIAVHGHTKGTGCASQTEISATQSQCPGYSY